MSFFGGAGGEYRVNLVWSSHGGQVLSTMGQIQGGMRGIGTTTGTTNRDLAGFNRQMQAIGTTLRYFVAGGAIFGTMNAFRQFAEFQGKLGDIAAISPDWTRGDITQVGNRLLEASTQMAVPVGELEESVRNIQSTLQGLEHEEATRFATEFGRLAQVAETDAYNAGNAVMGMRNAFQLGLGDMQDIAAQFFYVISTSAGMTGDEWAKFSGRVVAGAVQAGASLEEMNALMILMTRQGGTAATNVRHFQQFLMRLRQPTEEAKEAFAEIGLGPEQLATLPFMEIMERVNQAIQGAGGLNMKDLTEDQIAAVEETFGEAATPGQLGISGGGTEMVRRLFGGRLESLRSAGILFSQWNLPTTPGNRGLQDMLTDLEDQRAMARELDEAFARWLDRNRIQQAGTALRNMMTEALVPMEGLIGRISGGITGFAEGVGPTAVQGAAAGVGAYAIFKILRGSFGMARGLAGFLRGTGAGAMALAQGSAPPTGNFANPLWVMIHPMSGGAFRGLPGIPGTGTGGGGRGVPPVIASPGRLGRFMRFAARGAGVVGLGALAYEGIDSLRGDQEKSYETLRNNPPAPNLMARQPGSEQYILAAYRKAYERYMGTFVISRQNVGAESSQTVTLDLRIPDGSKASFKGGAKRKRVHVPVGHNAWSSGAIPYSRGTPGGHGGPQ